MPELHLPEVVFGQKLIWATEFEQTAFEQTEFGERYFGQKISKDFDVMKSECTFELWFIFISCASHQQQYFIFYYILYIIFDGSSKFILNFNIQTKNDDPLNYENENLFHIKIQINFIFKTHKHHHFQCFNWMFDVYMICCCSFNWFIQFIYLN